MNNKNKRNKRARESAATIIPSIAAAVLRATPPKQRGPLGTLRRNRTAGIGLDSHREDPSRAEGTGGNDPNLLADGLIVNEQFVAAQQHRTVTNQALTGWNLSTVGGCDSSDGAASCESSPMPVSPNHATQIEPTASHGTHRFGKSRSQVDAPVLEFKLKREGPERPIIGIEPHPHRLQRERLPASTVPAHHIPITLSQDLHRPSHY